MLSPTPGDHIGHGHCSRYLVFKTFSTFSAPLPHQYLGAALYAYDRIASPRQCTRRFSRAKVDAAKAYAAQLKSESGDMKSVVSAIQDSVLAAGMGINMHGDDGEPLRGSRV